MYTRSTRDVYLEFPLLPLTLLSDFSSEELASVREMKTNSELLKKLLAKAVTMLKGWSLMSDREPGICTDDKLNEVKVDLLTPLLAHGDCRCLYFYNCSSVGTAKELSVEELKEVGNAIRSALELHLGCNIEFNLLIRVSAEY